MATRTQKMGIGTIALGVFDWFARYQTGRDILTNVTGVKIANFAASAWLSPVILLIGFFLLYLDRLLGGGGTHHNNNGTPALRPPPASKADAAVSGSGNASIGDIHFHPPAITPPPSPPPLIPLPPQRREPRFNFRLVGRPYETHIEEKEWRLVLSSSDTRYSLTQDAIVLEIANTPAKEYAVDDAFNIVASYILTEPEVVTFAPLAWVGEGSGSIDILQGAPPQVLILAAAEYRSPENWRIPINSPHSFGHKVEEFKWYNFPPKGPHQVELVLSTGGRVVFSVMLEFTWETKNRPPSIKLMPPS